MNKKFRLTSAGTACALALLMSMCGCRSSKTGPANGARRSTSAPNSPDYASDIKPLVAATALPILHWPNFSDYQSAVQTFYDDRNFELAWTRDGKPTAQAMGFIRAFQDADSKGLNPDDYDGSLWTTRLQQLDAKSNPSIAQFDVAMTISVMRFISALHIGRVNPQHFNFDINTQEKKYDLPEFISNQAVDAPDIPKLVASAEPDSDIYRQTEQGLVHYIDLMKQQAEVAAQPLPTMDKALAVGQHYPAIDALTARLQLEGDLSEACSSSSSGNASKTVYTKELACGVKNYQARHSLSDDGKLTPATIKSLNVPLSDRVTQIADSLERWRWLPDPYLNPRLLVNLPEFLLRGFNDQHHVDFTMKVVIGKVAGEHQTPIFTHMMKYLIFRPYWNVPVDIAKKELVPHMVAKPGYLETKNYEVTTNKGKVLPEYTTSQVAHGMVMVREKPGPQNSLGLVKFMFPNQYDVYMHSTPEMQLFARSRRDYSHGCVRVQKADELAAWVLDGQQDWDLDKVQEAMNTGTDNHQVNLKVQLPVVIFYVTAMPADNGQMRFFDDIYHYDAQLQDVLVKGMPYPTKPEPVKPKTKPGDTV